MNATVDLDDQPLPMADKVDDIGTKRRLAAKVRARSSSRSAFHNAVSACVSALRIRFAVVSARARMDRSPEFSG